MPFNPKDPAFLEPATFNPAAKPKRYFTAKEFTGAGYYPSYAPEVLPQIDPVDYPSLKLGDLAIGRHKGSFLRPCPATPVYNCCGLNIIHIGQGCPLGCRYCALASYLGSEAVIRFGNYPEGLNEIEAVLKVIERLEPRENLTLAPKTKADNPTVPPTAKPPATEAPKPKLAGSPSPEPKPRSYRFCTGEFTDSLLYDQGFKVSEKLIALFKNYSKSVLELKTKTASVNHLLSLDHGGRTVISFSLNAPLMAEKLEPYAAPLSERIKAAKLAMTAGYPLGFHFDPIVYYPGFQEGYRQTAEMIDKANLWPQIAWISLGCFRYQAPLKTHMLAHNPSFLFDGEFILAHDGKYRYPRPLRILLYQTVLDSLKPYLDPKTTVYLCMESGRMWKDLLGFDPQTAGLTARFREPILSRPFTPETL
ncbi:MAG: hypothetical protein LBS60_06170 [Deltaproteobacteria bacterium]|nr:hypothetical protein [Deltaproteobacteria bacterium]